MALKKVTAAMALVSTIATLLFFTKTTHGNPEEVTSQESMVTFGKHRMLPRVTDWSRLGKSLYGEAERDRSGFSMALSRDGKRIAIGALENGGKHGKYFAGHVRVYEWKVSAWKRLGKDIDGVKEMEQMGRNVDISESGTYVAIGLKESARVYFWDGKLWQQIGGDMVAGLYPQPKISDDGKRLAIMFAQRIRVYDWDETDWIQTFEVAGEHKGLDLSGDGKRLAYTEGKMKPEKHVISKVFELQGTTWTQIANEIVTTGSSRFGNAVSMSQMGDRIAIGVQMSFTPGTRNVQVFECKTNSLTPMGEAILLDENQDQGPSSLSLSSDGERLAMGEWLRWAEMARARTFFWNATSWKKFGPEVVASQSGILEVSMSGNGRRVAVAEAGYDGPNGNDSGRVRIFEFPSEESKDSTEISIDVTPRKCSNNVKLRENKKVVVAILGGPDLEVDDVDFESIKFGPAGAAPTHFRRFRDINNDGYVDLIVRFRTIATGLSPQDNESCITALTKKNTKLKGCSSVRVIQKEDY